MIDRNTIITCLLCGGSYAYPGEVVTLDKVKECCGGKNFKAEVCGGGTVNLSHLAGGRLLCVAKIIDANSADHDQGL
jgi:hypothetical protein